MYVCVVVAGSLFMMSHSVCVCWCYTMMPSLAAASGLEELHIAVLGIGAVGKSALTLRFVRNMLVTDWDPTIEDEYAVNEQHVMARLQ